MKAIDRFQLISGLLVIGFFALQWINGRDQMADFRVYYDAAQYFFSGQTPYGEAFGVSSGYYKYAPGALLFFGPLSFLPYKLASSVFFFLIGGVFLLFIKDLLFHIQSFLAVRKVGWMLLFFGILVVDVMVRELHLGNINLLLLALLFWAFLRMQRQQEGSAGLLTGMAILLKPHFIVLVPWLILRRKWKVLMGASIAVVTLLLLPALFFGWNANVSMHGQWMDWMQIHNVKLIESPNTIYGIINHFVLQPLGIIAGNGLVFLCLALMAILVLIVMKRHSFDHASKADQYMEYGLILALIPNLTHTDTEHFLLSIPLLMVICTGLFRPLRSKYLILTLMLLACIPWLLNTPDIVGRKWAKIFDSGGLLGLSNLTFILLSFRLYYQMKVDREHLVESAA